MSSNPSPSIGNLISKFGKLGVGNNKQTTESVEGWGGEETNKNNSKRFNGGRKHRKTHKRRRHSKRRHTRRR